MPQNRSIEAMRLEHASIEVHRGDLVPAGPHPDDDSATVNVFVVGGIAATPLVMVDPSENEVRERLGLVPYDTDEVFILHGARVRHQTRHI